MHGGYYRFEVKLKHENGVRFDGFEVQNWKHPQLAEKALAVLLHFSITYLCEAELSFQADLKK